MTRLLCDIVVFIKKINHTKPKESRGYDMLISAVACHAMSCDVTRSKIYAGLSRMNELTTMSPYIGFNGCLEDRGWTRGHPY